jgi:hypothetical protein
MSPMEEHERHIFPFLNPQLNPQSVQPKRVFSGQKQGIRPVDAYAKLSEGILSCENLRQ